MVDILRLRLTTKVLSRQKNFGRLEQTSIQGGPSKTYQKALQAGNFFFRQNPKHGKFFLFMGTTFDAKSRAIPLTP